MNSSTDFSIGLWLSGFGHAVLISSVLVGSFFGSKILAPIPTSLTTKARFLSEKEYSAKLFLGRDESLKVTAISELQSTDGSALISLKHNNTKIGVNGEQLVGDESTSEIISNSVGIKSRDLSEVELNLKKDLEKPGLMLSDSSLNDVLSGKRETKTVLPAERKTLFESETLKPLLTDLLSKEEASLQSSKELYQNLPVIKISDEIIKEAFENDSSNDLVEKKMLQGILEPAVGECFNFDLVGQEPDILKADILVSFSLKENGKPIISSISFDSFSGGDYMTASKLFDAARRAIIRCGLKGYQLPKSKYSYWKNVEARFNLKGMSLK